MLTSSFRSSGFRMSLLRMLWIRFTCVLLSVLNKMLAFGTFKTLTRIVDKWLNSFDWIHCVVSRLTVRLNHQTRHHDRVGNHLDWIRCPFVVLQFAGTDYNTRPIGWLDPVVAHEMGMDRARWRHLNRFLKHTVIAGYAACHKAYGVRMYFQNLISLKSGNLTPGVNYYPG